MDALDSNHPTDQTLRAYGVGKLYGSLAESVHSHLSECGECRQRVAEISADTFLGRLRDAQARPDSPAPVRPPFAGISMTEGSQSSIKLPPAGSIPPGLAEHPDYDILGELGRGGMGVVYLAWNRLMGRKEVLKVVSRELMDRRGVLDRFLREIRNAAQLHHPNIVTAYSAIRAGESIVFAMEYVEGHDLGRLVKDNGPLPVAHACNVVYQAALGLQYAHEKGMVHRDIKPGNLILAREGRRAVVKVLDFGLAKATQEGPVDKGLTHEGQMLGTPDYIAPEQSLDAHKADIRADIYSLGCTLYYLLSGCPPFQAASLYELLQAHHSMEARPLNLMRPEVPWELAAVVAKMMAKEPARRYQTPGEVANAMRPFFKPHEPQSGEPKVEISHAGSSDVAPNPASVGAARPRAAELESAAPAIEKAAGPSRPGSMRESPVETREHASLADATHREHRRRARSLWLGTAAGVVMLAIVGAVARDRLWNHTQIVNLKLNNQSNLAQVIAGSSVTFSIDVQGARPPSVLLHYSVDHGKVFAFKEFSPGRNDRDAWQVTLKDVQQSLDYYVTGGDAETPRRRLKVLPAPTVTSVAIDLAFPPYTKVPPRTNIEGGTVEAIVGTRVTVHAATNVPALTAHLDLKMADSSWEPMHISAADPTVLTSAFTVKESGSYTIRFSNTSEQQNPGPVQYDVIAIPDRPPTARFVQPERPDVKIPANVKLDLVMTGTDDHGIKDATLHVKLGNEVLVSKNVLVGRPVQPKFRAAETLDLERLRIKPGSTLTYKMMVRDNKEPSPNGTETETRVIEVTGVVWTSPSTKMAFVGFEGGDFMMGSGEGDADAENDEKPPHKVRVSPFYLGVNEVTQEQYRTVTRNNPSWFSSTGGGREEVADRSTDRLPVENVSWHEAIRFCNALSKKDGKSAYYDITGDNVRVPNPKGSGYRLPTEAEWEYACRAGDPKRYSFGDDPSRLGDYAWYDGNSSGLTHLVRQTRPNGFGLYDMHGNVWEWCWDGYDDAYYKRSPDADPPGARGASGRVTRGGSWGSDPPDCRSANRGGYDPAYRSRYLGFRLALSQSGR